MKKCQETNSSLAASLEQLLQKTIQDHFSGQDAKVSVEKENPGKVCNFKNIRLSEKNNNYKMSDYKWPDEELKKKWLAGDQKLLENLRLTGLYYH